MSRISDTPADRGRRNALRCGGAALATATLGGCVAGNQGGGQTPPGNAPLTSADLAGKTLRVYHTGDPLTRDLRQDRANIELGPDDRIVSVWIG